ncbi:MAG: PQQ-like beta-propeller repeat protein [Spirochaetes bacterium]|nr:PQQ-like beta-propeller repeat protein [Spirochaetota bacterium]
MEREFNQLARQLEPWLVPHTKSTDVQQSTATEIAQRVYARRRSTLLPRLPVLPALIGCLFLSGGLSLFVKSANELPPRPLAIERVSPDTVESIWEKYVNPQTGNDFFLSLNLQNSLRAYDAKSRRVLWSTHLPVIAPNSAPLVFANSGRVCVAIASENGTLSLFNAVSGQLQWIQNLETRVAISPLSVQDKMLVIASATGTIFGIRAHDGQVAYKLDTRSPLTALELVSDAQGDVVYAITDQHRVLALRAMTGGLMWRREIAGVASDSPILSANHVIAPTAEGNSSKFWAYDVSGNLSWVNTFSRYQTLASTDGFIAIAQGSIVTLIKAETGEPIHYWQLGATPSTMALSTHNGNLIVTTDQGNLVSVVN